MKHTIIAATMVLLSAGGCRITKVCNSDGGMEISQTEGAKAEILASDVCFRDGLSVENVSFVRNELGFLTSTVTVRNCHGDPEDYGREDAFFFRYRFMWLDANGAEVLPGAAIWRVEKIGGGASARVTDTAPSREAKSFVLRFAHSR